MFLTDKKKRSCATALIFVMLMSLVGCGKKNDSDASTDSSIPAITTDIITETTTEEDIAYDLTSPEAIAEQKRFAEFTMKEFREGISSDSISLHYYLVHPENYDIKMDVATLGDAYCLTDEEIEESRANSKEETDEFYSFDYNLLTAEQKFDYDVYKYSMDSEDAYYDYYYMQEPFAYTSGLHSNMPINYSEYVFRSADDIPMYLDLLEQLDDYMNQGIEFEKIRMEKGLFMNRHSANEVIRQCNEFIADPEHNLLIETFNAKLDELDGLDAELAEEYKTRNYDIVMNEVIPCYKNIISFFKENKTKGKNDLGMCYLENGKEYYEYLLANQTGTGRTPEEIIELYEARMKEYTNEMTSVAFANYDDYMEFVDDFDNLYDDVDPDETLRYFEEITKSSFPELPRFEYNISNVHESLQEIVSPAFYMLAPIDNYKENSIRLNITGETGNDLWSTLAHEGIPGHMYQRNYFLQTNPDPLRAIMGHMGYTEGWATYVQNMSYSYYEFKHPCYADLARINTELSLIIQARVDLGVNYEGWTLDDTKKFLSTNGFSEDAAQDVMDYVIAEPANYQAYVLGWLEIDDLRRTAENELGDSFDEIEFHKVILDAGPCPFPVLKQRVDKYIQSAK